VRKGFNLNKIFHPVFKLILLLSVCLFILSCSRNNESGLNPGDLPPNLDLKTLDGAPFSPETLRGKVVLINFWASWCGPCVAELPSLQILYDKLKDQGFVVIGVGVDDDEESLRSFQNKYSLKFPILIDKTGAVKSKFKISGVPESFVLGKDGRLVLLLDPAGNMPAVRIVGPREWSSPSALARFKELLKSEA